MPSGRSLSLLSLGSRLPFWCGDLTRAEASSHGLLGGGETPHRLPKPYCWEIYRADRLQTVQRSMISYKSEAMARIDGERAAANAGGTRRSTIANAQRANPSAQTRTMTVIDYKGYRIEVCPVGKGWRASIFSPGSTSPWPNSPVNLEKSSMQEIVAEAKRIIEVRLGPGIL